MYKMVLFCTLTYSLALECASNILVFGMALLSRIVSFPSDPSPQSEFTQAVLDNRELDRAMHKAIIEELSFLISQTSAKPEQKRPSIVNAVLKSIKETLSTFSGLIALWEKLEPCLREVLFGRNSAQ